MSKILLIMLLILCVLSGSLYFLRNILELTKENILTILGFYFVFNGTILVFTQIQITLRFNQRKASLDFIFGGVTSTLLPYEQELKKALKKPSLTFEAGEKAHVWLNSLTADEQLENKTIIINILNFYERMSLGILKEGYDEDICYDDRGFMLTNFYRWVEDYVLELRTKHNEPRLFANVEFLAVIWSNRMIQERESLNRHQASQRQLQIIRNRRIT